MQLAIFTWMMGLGFRSMDGDHRKCEAEIGIKQRSQGIPSRPNEEEPEGSY